MYKCLWEYQKVLDKPLNVVRNNLWDADVFITIAGSRRIPKIRNVRLFLVKYTKNNKNKSVLKSFWLDMSDLETRFWRSHVTKGKRCFAFPCFNTWNNSQMTKARNLTINITDSYRRNLLLQTFKRQRLSVFLLLGSRTGTRPLIINLPWFIRNLIIISLNPRRLSAFRNYWSTTVTQRQIDFISREIYRAMNI